MSAHLTIPSEQLNYMAKLFDVSIEQLKLIQSDSESSDWMQPKEMEDGLAKTLKDDQLGKLVRRLLLGWRTFSFQQTVPIESVIEGMRAGLLEAAPEDSDIVSKFDERRSLLIEILKSKGVRRVAKIMLLSYEYANLFQSARLLTDIRPIFDDNGDVFVDAVVSHTLSLKYESANTDKIVHLALDINDIKSLLDQCQRALKKTDATKAFLVRHNVKTVVSGEN